MKSPWQLVQGWVPALRESLPQPKPIRPWDLLLLLGAAVVVQLLFLRPPFPSDSIAYFWWADSLLSNEVSHGTTRLGVLLPARFGIGLFGPSEFAYYLAPLAMFMLTCLSVFVLGMKLAGSRAVAWVAAAAFALAIPVLELSSQLLPDPFAAAWFSCALACFLMARSSGRPELWIGVGAASLGASYLSREYVLFLVPVIVLVAVLLGWRRRDWLILLAVTAGVLVVESAAMLVMFSDPLARVSALVGFAEKGASGTSALLAAYGADATRWDVLTRAMLAFWDYGIGKILVLAPPVALLMAVFDQRRRGFWVILTVWFFSLWIPMMLLAGILDPSSPRIRDNHVRYWFLVVPMLFLALASAGRFLIADFGRDGRRHTAAFGAVAVLLLGGFVATDHAAVKWATTFRLYGATQWWNVRDWLRSQGDSIETVYIDSRMSRVFPIYTREPYGDLIWSGSVEIVDAGNELLPVDEIHDALVIHQLGVRYLAGRGLRPQDVYSDLGIAWQTSVKRSDGSLGIYVERSLLELLDMEQETALSIDHIEVPPVSWVPLRDLEWVDSGLRSTGTDPQVLFGPVTNLPPDAVLEAHVDAREETTAQLFWRSGDQEFSRDRTIRARVDADSGIVRFDLRGIDPRSEFRLDPGEQAGVILSRLRFLYRAVD